MKNSEAYAKYLELEKQMNDSRKEFETFREQYSQQLREHENSVWAEKRQKAKAKQQREIEVHEKIMNYLEPEMWVKIKTRSGSIFQKVLEVSNNAVLCARPANTRHVKFDRKTGKYTVPELTLGNVGRTDVYFSRSFVSVLVPDGDGFYDEKSFKKDLFK